MTGTDLATLRGIADEVHARRPEWAPGEVLTALRRALDNYPETGTGELARGAFRIAENSSIRTPWALTAVGSDTYSRQLGRPVEAPRLMPTPPPVREVIGIDPHAGDETARAVTYARGSEMARRALDEARLARQTEDAAREAEKAAERAERRAVAARLAVLAELARPGSSEPVIDAEIVDDVTEVIGW
jgi:hypothetical protein